MQFLLTSILACSLIFSSVAAREISSRKLFSNVEDGPFGGEGGYPWDDGTWTNLMNGPVTAIELRTGWYQFSDVIIGIRARYGGTWGAWRGGSGTGQSHTFELNPGAGIEIVQGRAARFIDALEFISSDTNIYGPYGGSGGSTWTSAHPGCTLAYLSGAATDVLDSLKLHYLCP